jgi:hypothetical protein
MTEPETQNDPGPEPQRPDPAEPQTGEDDPQPRLPDPGQEETRGPWPRRPDPAEYETKGDPLPGERLSDILRERGEE